MTYSFDEEQRLIELYIFGSSLKTISNRINRGELSCQQKLVELGLWVGEVPYSKSELISELAVLLGVKDIELESLSLANKGVLRLLRISLTKHR